MPRALRSCGRLLGEAAVRVRAAVPAVLVATAVLFAARSVAPPAAHAVDLFPIDNWLGSGIKKLGDVVLGPLKLGAKEIATLLATIVGAIADLLVPKSFVRAGLAGIRWLVELPELGGSGGRARAMPHVAELRDTLTWIGLTLLPLQIVVAAGRAFVAPSLESDSPAEVLQRAIVAGLGLLLYDWAWATATRLVHLLTDALLGLPWVDDGVQQMLQTLLIGGVSGTAVASEFVIPLLLVAAGGTLLALLLMRVGLEVAGALIYTTGGLALGASVTRTGQRVLDAWLIAAGAVFLLPVLWALVFVCGAALMLDARSAPADGLLGFIGQLYDVAAALAVFAVAIKLARGVFRHAAGAITTIAGTLRGAGSPGSGRGGASGGGTGRAWAERATPASVARFSQRLRSGMATGARAVSSAASYPVRHPIRTAQATSYPLRRPVQATQEAADGLRATLTGGAQRAATAGRSVQAQASQRLASERHDGPFSKSSADARRGRRQGQPARNDSTQAPGPTSPSSTRPGGQPTEPTRAGTAVVRPSPSASQGGAGVQAGVPAASPPPPVASPGVSGSSSGPRASKGTVARGQGGNGNSSADAGAWRWARVLRPRRKGRDGRQGR